VNTPVLTSYLARSMGIRDKLDSVPFDAVPPDRYHLGIRKSHPDGAEILELFDKIVVAARADGSLDKILSAYA